MVSRLPFENVHCLNRHQTDSDLLSFRATLWSCGIVFEYVGLFLNHRENDQQRLFVLAF